MTIVTTRYCRYEPRRRRRGGARIVDLVAPTVNDATGTWSVSAIDRITIDDGAFDFMFWNVRASARGNYTQDQPRGLTVPIGGTPMTVTAWYRATGGSGGPGSPTIVTDTFSSDRDEFVDELAIQSVDPPTAWFPAPDDDLIGAADGGARVDAKDQILFVQDFERWVVLCAGSADADVLSVDKGAGGDAIATYRAPVGASIPELVIPPEGNLILGDVKIDGSGLIVRPDGSIVPIGPYDPAVRGALMALVSHDVLSRRLAGENIALVDVDDAVQRAVAVVEASQHVVDVGPSVGAAPDVERIQAEYDKSVAAWSGVAVAQLGTELQALADKAPMVEGEGEALAMKLGFDGAAIAKQVEAWSHLPIDEAQDGLTKLDQELTPKVAEVVEHLHLDVPSLRAELLTELAVPAKVVPLGGQLDLGWRWTPVTPPPPEPSEIRLVAPFRLHHTSGVGGFTDVTRGYVIAQAAASAAYTGVVTASLGAVFQVAPDVAQVRVQVVVDTRWRTMAMAGLGYSSAESAVRLKLLDGSRVVAEDHTSLARSIAPGIWFNQQSSNGLVPLSCEVPRPAGVAANLAAVVEVEAWAGSAGNAAANSMTSVTVYAIDVAFRRR